ncbi:hypothetical protein [Moraxella cuniculi]|nr:hypothetical protein [Moraxella cuniculi]
MMKPNNIIHIVIAAAFILYVAVEIKDFYQSKPYNNYRNRKQLLEQEFPLLMGRIAHNISAPSRVFQIDRQAGSVVLTYYYDNPSPALIQTIKNNISQEQWQMIEVGKSEILYCKDGILLTLGEGVTNNNTVYQYIDLSWQLRQPKCKRA